MRKKEKEIKKSKKISEIEIGDKFKFIGNNGYIEILEIFKGKSVLELKFKIKAEPDIYNINEYCKNNWISKEELYDLLDLGERSVYTHNCMERLVCGQLGSVSSRMALDDQQATTIDGRHKGAGIVKAQSIVSHIQYFFEDQKWLFNWFKDRGMTEKGWDKNELVNGQPLDEVDPNDIDLGEDEEVSITKQKTVIEFQDIKKEVDNDRDQKFTEV